MRKLIVLLLLCGGCAPRPHLFWNARDLVLLPAQTIALTGPGDRLILEVNKQTVQKIFLAHLRITRAANVQAELLFFDEADPNAFAGLIGERRVVAINTAMMKLIGDDNEEFAALLGHEAAHWARGHADAAKARSNRLTVLGTLLGAGLAMAGVPGAGYISGFAVDLIDASYSRDDEREADAFGLEYMMASGFDPAAAVRLHQKMLKQAGGVPIPFLNSHPSGEERVENLKRLIAAKGVSPPEPGGQDGASQ